MAKATSAFTFNQSADFGTSIAAFREHMTGIDNVLGAALTASHSGLWDDTVSQGDLWTSLFPAIEAAKASAGQATAPTAVATPVTITSSPNTGHNGVTGWLL